MHRSWRCLAAAVAAAVLSSGAHADNLLEGLEMDVIGVGESPAEATARIALPKPLPRPAGAAGSRRPARIARNGDLPDERSAGYEDPTAEPGFAYGGGPTPSAAEAAFDITTSAGEPPPEGFVIDEIGEVGPAVVEPGATVVVDPVEVPPQAVPQAMP
ncbi:MAG: hypothetical protein ACT4QA_24150 [Panacagrimonas sp.]